METKTEIAKPEKRKKRAVIRLKGCGRFTSGNIQKDKKQPNTYRLFLNYKDENGKWKAITKTYRPENSKEPSVSATEDLLRAWAEEILNAEADAEIKRLEEERLAREAAEVIKNQKPTVSEYLAKYIEARQKAGRRTKSDYRGELKNHIAPYIGNRRLDELEPPDVVQSWIDDLTKEYEPKTIRKAFILFRAAMQEAVDRDIIDKNPCRTVETPPLPNRNPNALDVTGRAKVLHHIDTDPTSAVNIALSLALLLGMRSGEICGLKWRYVDLQRKQLKVTKALKRDDSAKGSNHWFLGAPKTEKSDRDLDIPEQLIEPLEVRLAEAKKNASEQGLKWQEYFVTGFEDGSPMNGDMLTHRWRDIALQLNLVGIEGKRPTFHDLRHTWTTKAVNDGTDIKTVSSVLGHASAAMTLNVYASADPKAKKQAVHNTANSMFAEAGL